MAKKKQTKVTLKATGKTKRERKFPKDVAEEILNMRYPGYELADKNFIFKDGNLIENGSSRTNQDTEESSGS